MSKKEKARVKIPWMQYLCGGALGAVFAFIVMSEAHSVLGFAVGFCSLILSFFLHVILHEGGHLVAGLASGYKFVSFRIGSIMWIKTKGRIYRKNFSIPGTGGQCLLEPPDIVDGKYPALLYNLGGGLSNLFFAAVAAAAAFALGTVYAKVILLPFALVGLYLAVSNLLPLKVGGIANDGYNIKTFRRDGDSARAFWIQMKVNKLQSDGDRLRDMPEEYFALADSEEKGNPLIDAVKMFNFQKKIDEKDFAGARATGEKLLAERGLLDLYKNMICVELLFLELIAEARPEAVERLYTPALKQYLKLVKGYPSTHRLRYAYAVRYAHDDEMAQKAKMDFDRVLKAYPMPGEIQMERELMEEI